MYREQRATIKNMLVIPNLITAYTDKLKNVRKMFFLTHSLIGVKGYSVLKSLEEKAISDRAPLA